MSNFEKQGGITKKRNQLVDYDLFNLTSKSL